MVRSEENYGPNQNGVFFTSVHNRKGAKGFAHTGVGAKRLARNVLQTFAPFSFLFLVYIYASYFISCRFRFVNCEGRGKKERECRASAPQSSVFAFTKAFRMTFKVELACELDLLITSPNFSFIFHVHA